MAETSLSTDRGERTAPDRIRNPDRAGYADTVNTLKQHQWLNLPPDGGGIWVHDVHRIAEGLRRGA